MAGCADDDSTTLSDSGAQLDSGASDSGANDGQVGAGDSGSSDSEVPDADVTILCTEIVSPTGARGALAIESVKLDTAQIVLRNLDSTAVTTTTDWSLRSRSGVVGSPNFPANTVVSVGGSLTLHVRASGMNDNENLYLGVNVDSIHDPFGKSGEGDFAIFDDSGMMDSYVAWEDQADVDSSFVNDAVSNDMWDSSSSFVTVEDGDVGFVATGNVTTALGFTATDEASCF
ncbi:MAG: hypothetical protein AAF355_14505 [Myxococcota bacterium]